MNQMSMPLEKRRKCGILKIVGVGIIVSLLAYASYDRVRMDNFVLQNVRVLTSPNRTLINREDVTITPCQSNDTTGGHKINTSFFSMSVTEDIIEQFSVVCNIY